jgi:4-hydroxybenzoate polyprenyltransferase
MAAGLMASKFTSILDLVKFSHTIFALPFALIACLVVANGIPALPQLGWIVLAMVGARTSAMAFNRIVDRKIDTYNPRTARRPLQTGTVKLWEAIAIWLVSGALLVLAAWQLNHLAFYLSFPVLFILYFYSITKRFTSLSHYFLGLALACAPMGAWVAIAGRIAWPPVVLGLAVLFWVAGFDVIYSCQDEQHDKRHNLHSLVVSLGRANALLASRISHICAVLLLILFGLLSGLGLFYYLGATVAALALCWEQSLVRPDDISKVDVAFFTANGFVGIALLIFTAVDVLL